MSAFVNFHTHLNVENTISVFSYSLGEGYPVPPSPSSAAIHPWAVDNVDITDALSQLLTANIVAVGETGLDYACTSSRAKQKEVFELQIEIAHRRHLPVIIHCVKAQEEVEKILAKYDLSNIAFHGYIGSKNQVYSLLKQGYYISFGEVSLQSAKTVEALHNMPLDKLFLETDASHISIQEIYVRAAEILKIDVEQLKNQIYNNYKIFFK